MNNKIVTEVSKILGVSEASILSLPEEIQNDMESIVKEFTVEDDADKVTIYTALEEQWQKGSIWLELSLVADSTGIPYKTLRNLPNDTRTEYHF